MEQELLTAKTLTELAAEVFGSEQKAAVWIARPTVVFGDQSPLDYLKKDPAVASPAIRTILGRIEHGISYGVTAP